MILVEYQDIGGAKRVFVNVRKCSVHGAREDLGGPESDHKGRGDLSQYFVGK